MEQSAWIARHEDVLRVLEQEIETWGTTKFRRQLIAKGRKVWSN